MLVVTHMCTGLSKTVRLFYVLNGIKVQAQYTPGILCTMDLELILSFLISFIIACAQYETQDFIRKSIHVGFKCVLSLMTIRCVNNEHLLESLHISPSYFIIEANSF